MSNIFKEVAIIATIFFGSTGYAASFDCAKAKTMHEKFICTNPKLDALDKQLGEAYSGVNKIFPLRGYIPSIHRSWLISYRNCAGNDKNKKDSAEALKICMEQVEKRISLYSDLIGASVYTDYKDKELVNDGGTFIIFEKNQMKFLRYFGGWMPDGNMSDVNKMKGFPYDGFWCDDTMTLKKKGSNYIAQDAEDGTSDDFEIKIADKSIIVKGTINCGLRAVIGEGNFEKR